MEEKLYCICIIGSLTMKTSILHYKHIRNGRKLVSYTTRKRTASTIAITKIIGVIYTITSVGCFFVVIVT